MSLQWWRGRKCGAGLSQHGQPCQARGVFIFLGLLFWRCCAWWDLKGGESAALQICLLYPGRQHGVSARSFVTVFFWACPQQGTGGDIACRQSRGHFSVMNRGWAWAKNNWVHCYPGPAHRTCGGSLSALSKFILWKIWCFPSNWCKGYKKYGIRCVVENSCSIFLEEGNLTVHWEQTQYVDAVELPQRNSICAQEF